MWRESLPPATIIMLFLIFFIKRAIFMVIFLVLSERVDEVGSFGPITNLSDVFLLVNFKAEFLDFF